MPRAKKPLAVADANASIAPTRLEGENSVYLTSLLSTIMR